MSEWISVKDRLPELDQIVHVCFPRGNTPVYTYGARLDDGEGWCWGAKAYGCAIDPTRDATYNDIEVDDDYPVSHWMPLATPPSESHPSTTCGE